MKNIIKDFINGLKKEHIKSCNINMVKYILMNMD